MDDNLQDSDFNDAISRYLEADDPDATKELEDLGFNHGPFEIAPLDAISVVEMARRSGIKDLTIHEVIDIVNNPELLQRMTNVGLAKISELLLNRRGVKNAC
jgi:hypothetical protein